MGYYRVDSVTGEPVNVDTYRVGRGCVVVREWVGAGVERTSFHAVSMSDRSSEWPTWAHYDAQCGWCYLGAPHTADAHTVEVLRKL